MASKVIEFRLLDHSNDPEQFIEAVTIRQPQDICRASQILAGFVEEHGMRIMVWHDISSQVRMTDAVGNDLNATVFGWNSETNELWPDYDSASSSHLIRACRVEGEPFWVNRNGYHTSVRNAFLDGIGLDGFDEKSLFKAAIVFPVHRPFGQISVAIISSMDPAKTDLSVEFAELSGLFAKLSRRFLISYVTAMRENPYLPSETVLTLREIECLRWAAFGKTDKETALILDWSHATIRYYVERVCKKLGAVNRAQAIFRAAQLGYLGSEK